VTLIAFAILVILAATAATAAAQVPPAISVVGNELKAGGQAVQLRGVNRAAYNQCDFGVYDHYNDTTDDFADGPVDQTSISAMTNWDINVVRVTVSESCWLGQPAVPAPGQVTQPTAANGATAAQYRQAVENYVNLLGQDGLYVILSLYSTAPSGYASSAVDMLPDAANAPTFWQQAASAFGTDHWVMFDLSNEDGIDQYDSTLTEAQIYSCWLKGTYTPGGTGCSVPSLSATAGSPPVPVDYTPEGIQGLINTVRTAGDATTPLIIGTPDYDYWDPDPSHTDASLLSEYLPHDPDGQLIYDTHLYDSSLPDSQVRSVATSTPINEQAALSTATSYLQDTVLPIAESAPVMIGELGQFDCDDTTNPESTFVTGVLDEVNALAAQPDGATLSVMGWTWDANTDHETTPALTSGQNCPTAGGNAGLNDHFDALIRDYDGTPTVMGAAFRLWFAGFGPPVESAPPVISDPASPQWVAGDTVSTTAGSWVLPPSSYTYTWSACTSAGTCAPVATSTSTSPTARYTPTPADVGDAIQVQVTAANAKGTSQPVSSTAVGPVISPTPVDLTAPAVSASSASSDPSVTQVGQTATCAPGSWSGEGVTYTYFWYANGVPQAPSAGSTSPSFAIPDALIGQSLTCGVLAADAAGTAAEALAGNAIQIQSAPTFTARPTVTLSGTTYTCAGAAVGNDTAPSTMSFQWLSGGTAIGGEDMATIPASTVTGVKGLSCEVSVVAANGSATITSANAVDVPVPPPPITSVAATVRCAVVAHRPRSCRFELRLRPVAADERGAPTSLGTVTVTVGARRSRRVTVALSAASRRLLAKRGTLPATLSISETLGGRRTLVSSRRVTFTERKPATR
jgi:hypothetical protein